MKKPSAFLSAILLLWAGLALGGNVIAAPAKFQVDSLTLSQLLQVGRAQFAWLGLAELAFASVAVLLSAFVDWRLRIPVLIAVMLFGIQHFGLQPLLEARTNVIVSGAPAPESSLHLWFIAIELAKMVTLLTGGLLHVTRNSRDTSE